MKLFAKALSAGQHKRVRGYQARVAQVNDREDAIEAMSDESLAVAVEALREQAADGTPLDDLLVESFALTREAGRRALGMRHFDVQLIGGMAMAEGAIAEMRTGEGKTLTATLPAVLHALAGEPVHVVTVNDYLARRDAEWMGPLYRQLGLTVGVSLDTDDAEAKRGAYAADITYVTNSELGFDFLRDNLVTGLDDRVMRGRAFALVDEVDNILIDEARTPLIISGESEEPASVYQDFARLAREMQLASSTEGAGPPAGLQAFARTQMERYADADGDYTVDEKEMTVSVTEAGVAKAEQFLGVENLYEHGNGHLVNHLLQALRAQALYHEGVHYTVIDGGVGIIDESTGRILEGRVWSDGLHQAVEAKEGLQVTTEQHTVATITYQNFFRDYPTLCGMTGTAATDAQEFHSTYKLHVVEVPTHRPVTRVDHVDRLYATRAGKLAAVAAETRRRQKTGQPVLVGTVSVEDSEALSVNFTDAGIEHVLLNAKPERAALESEIIAQAGQLGAVTIATNMAGRGVDIKLGGDAEQAARAEALDAGEPGTGAYEMAYNQALGRYRVEFASQAEKVVAAGGLCVLGTERHESRRIDNQLRGRSGRQGDPGSTQFFMSGEDRLLRLFGGGRFSALLSALPAGDDGEEMPLESKALAKRVEKAQEAVEAERFLERKRVLEYDDVYHDQRTTVYQLRDMLLTGDVEGVGRRIAQAIAAVADVPETDFDARAVQAQAADWGVSVDLSGVDFPNQAADLIKEAFTAAYRERVDSWPQEHVEAIQRLLVLSNLDRQWSAHLADMDYLRRGIGLRGLAGEEPARAFKREAFDLFSQMMQQAWRESAVALLTAEVVINEEAA